MCRHHINRQLLSMPANIQQRSESTMFFFHRKRFIACFLVLLRVWITISNELATIKCVTLKTTEDCEPIEADEPRQNIVK